MRSFEYVEYIIIGHLYVGVWMWVMRMFECVWFAEVCVLEWYVSKELRVG